jgi:hypothetical protein
VEGLRLLSLGGNPLMGVTLDVLSDIACSSSYAASDGTIVSPVLSPNSALSAGEGAAIHALLSASLGATTAHHMVEAGATRHLGEGADTDSYCHEGSATSVYDNLDLDARPMHLALTSMKHKQEHPRSYGGYGSGAGSSSSMGSSSLKRSAPGYRSGRSLSSASHCESPSAAGAAVAITDLASRKSGSKRARYDDGFKEQVVREAMLCPEGARIKPTCSRYPGVEPCQVCEPFPHSLPLCPLGVLRSRCPSLLSVACCRPARSSASGFRSSLH